MGIAMAMRNRASSWGSLLLVTPSLYLLWGMTAIEFTSAPQFLWLFAFCAAIAHVLVWFQQEPRPRTAWSAVAAFLIGVWSFPWVNGLGLLLHHLLCRATGR
jgi:RsiW-degrading membrane proteinase PrsW (M82 family)